MDRRIAGLVEELRSEDAERSAGAREALEDLGPDALHAMLGALADGNERVRAAAIAAAALHGTGSPRNLRAMLRAAQASLRLFHDPECAADIHASLSEAAGALVPMLPGLAAELRDPDPAVHGPAARDLESATHYLGPVEGTGESVLPALLEALEDDCGDVRWWCAAAVGHLALDPERSVPAVARVLGGDPSALVRHAAVEALEAFGEDAAPGAPALVEATGDPDIRVAVRAVAALARTGTGGSLAVETVTALLGHADASMRGTAAAALGAFAAVPRASVEALERTAAGDAAEEVRAAAAHSLLRIRQRHGSL